jgi:glycosyltransferase involved in cell wall biosynthesis
MIKLKIGFDAKRLFCNKEGLGSYARTLLMDMQTLYPNLEYHLYTPQIDESVSTDYFKNNSNFVIHTPSSKSFLWRYSKITEDLVRDNIHVYVGLSNELPRGLSKAGIKSILVVHDLLYKFFPEQFNLVDRKLIQHKLKNAIHEADRVVAVSEHTAHDIGITFPTAKEKTSVIYQSVNKDFRNKENINPQRSYFLCVGSINNRKNLKQLVYAYDHIPPDERQVTIIVGTGKEYKQELVELIKEKAYEHLFKFKGYVSNKNLVELYKNALALIFPSQYEGFGIPILESLHMNVPVIASSVSSLPEVVGQHGIVIDYNDHVALANAIKHISIKDSQTTYLKELKDHLHKFSPELICRKYVSLIEELSTLE